MRTLVDIPDEDIQKLDAIAAQEKRSRASAIRDAVKLYLVKNAEDKSWIERAYGLWADRDDIGDAVILVTRNTKDFPANRSGSLHSGLKADGYIAAMTQRRRLCTVHDNALVRRRAEGKLVNLVRRSCDDPLPGTYRHRPHPLGHPRRADRGQRAPPCHQGSWRWSTTASSRISKACATR
jgi:predicted transcriptional regulator